MAQPELTTTFTPPASCFDPNTILDVWTTVCAGGLASCQYQVLGQAPDGSKTCMPPGYTPGGNNYYSPGICPSGYATACSSLNSVGSLTETVATCCPSGYTCAPVLSSYTWQWQPTLGCWSSYSSLSLSAMTVISGGQTFQTPFSTGAGAVNAYSVEVRLQATDLPLLNGQITSASPHSSSSISSSSPTSASPSPPPPSHGIAAGGAAGIGIGVALALILAFTGAFLLFRRRRRQRHLNGGSGIPENAEQYTAQDKYASPAVGYGSTVFSGGSARNSGMGSPGGQFVNGGMQQQHVVQPVLMHGGPSELPAN